MRKPRQKIPRSTAHSRWLNENGYCSSCGMGRLNNFCNMCDKCGVKQRERARIRLGIPPERWKK